MDPLNSNLDCNETINQLGVEMNQVLGGNECEKLSHTHNNNHRVQKLTKRSQQSDKQSEQYYVPPKGPFLTDSWCWMKSSARHTLSNNLS